MVLVHFLWDIPDRRCVSPLLVDHRYFGTHGDVEAFGIVSRPAWRGNFEHTNVVKGLFTAVEIRILPGGRQLHITDSVAPGRFRYIHGIANRRQLVSNGVLDSVV